MSSATLLQRLNDGSDKRFRLLLTILFGLVIINSYVPTGYNWEVPNLDVQATGSWGKRLQWLPLYVIALFVLWSRRVLAWHLLPHLNPFLLLFALWATVSVFWSFDSGATLRRAIQIWGLILIAMAFVVAGWDRNRFVDMMRNFHGLLIVWAYVWVFVFPDLGVHHGDDHSGAWRGVTAHKNAMGVLAATTFLLWMHGWAGRRVIWFKALPFVLMAGLFLVMTRSSTSLLAALAGAPLIWILARPPVSSEAWLLKIIFVLLVFLALPVHLYVVAYGLPSFADLLGPIAALFGKDVSLTGRSDIWELIWQEVLRHPIQGTGYGAYWLGEEGPSGIIKRKLYFYPAQSHNGYLDILNETGLIGLLLVLGLLVTHLIKLQRAGLDRCNLAMHVGLITVMLIWNITESTLFRTASSWTVFIVTASIVVSRAHSPLSRGWRSSTEQRPPPRVQWPTQTMSPRP